MVPGDPADSETEFRRAWDVATGEQLRTLPGGPALMASAHAALPWSIAVTGTALAVFGWIRGHLTGVWPVRTALQTILIGGLAAAAAFLIARAIS